NRATTAARPSSSPDRSCRDPRSLDPAASVLLAAAGSKDRGSRHDLSGEDEGRAAVVALLGRLEIPVSLSRPVELHEAPQAAAPDRAAPPTACLRPWRAMVLGILGVTALCAA